jgi:Protein of unknown function (DUF3306)
MSEGFLSRWSRRKRESVSSPVSGKLGTGNEAGSIPPAPLGGEGGEDQRSEPGGGDYARSEFAQAPPTPDPSPPRAARAGGGEPEGAEREAPVFDPTSLPPIESIDAGSDVSAFLRPGVPADLARAALRRAWVADPAIRDFVGLAENAWDFNAPGGVPGFEPLRAIDDAWRLAAQLTGAAPAPAPEAPVAAAARGGDGEPVSDAAQQSPMLPSPPKSIAPEPASDAATQKDESIEPVRRRHGGALAE